ncbi:MAG: MazG family protein [Dehalococcoidia bacterium]|nr:MazG family protein [Dehalococcoidia bacterium]
MLSEPTTAAAEGRRDDLARFIEVLDALGLTPGDVQVYAPGHAAFDASRPLLVLAPDLEGARAAIADRYPAGHATRAVLEGHALETTVELLPDGASAWLVEPLAPEEDARSLSGLRAVMERLYGPEGCPWDREQTHETLRKYLLEECYELVDAIDRGDLDALREELGDLLAHVLMHTAMAQEAGAFSLEDVTAGALRKMVRRHPHVFGEEAAGSNEELLARWDEIKAAEREEREEGGAEASPGALDSVPRAAPSLQRAQSLQQRAARAGALEPGDDAIGELAATVGTLTVRPGAGSYAAVLWAAVRAARALDLDAEEALRERAGVFASAFAELEAEARAIEVTIEALPVESRQRPWVT